MAKKTNFTVTDKNGVEHNYYRMTKVVGHKLNDKGKEVPVRKSFIGSCKSEAEKKYQDYLEKKNAGLETKTQYFGILADSWISEFFVNDGSLKDSTKARYVAAWNRTFKPKNPNKVRSTKAVEIYHLPMDSITAKTLQSIYNEMAKNGAPVSEIKTIHKIMKKFYSYISLENLGRDVTAPLKIPKEKVNAANKDITVWTDEEINTILGSFDKADNRFRHRFLIVLAYYTGCRKSELLALTYDDITEDGVRITKTLAEVSDGLVNGKMKTHVAATDPKTKNSIRTIPVDPVVMEELKIHKKWHKAEQLKNGYRSNYIFTTDSGEFYNNKNLDVAIFRYYKKIGVEPKTMHTYRHTYASNLCKLGAPMKDVCELLGHESIETTAKYYVAAAKESKRNTVLLLRKIINE